MTIHPTSNIPAPEQTITPSSTDMPASKVDDAYRFIFERTLDMLCIVDTQVANALMRAAQAVKLLGAQVMLTGIRPEVAQTLVGLGVDLSMIITRSSLQSGIALAMQNVRSRSK